MGEPVPVTVAWTDHALVKAQLLSISRADVEDLILSEHARRTANTGAADWLLSSNRLAVAYNFSAGDELTP